MKNLKVFLLITIAILLFTALESFSYPRYRMHRTYRIPVYHTRIVRTYYVVKKPKFHHKHHKRITKKVIYY